MPAVGGHCECRISHYNVNLLSLTKCAIELLLKVGPGTNMSYTPLHSGTVAGKKVVEWRAFGSLHALWRGRAGLACSLKLRYWATTRHGRQCTINRFQEVGDVDVASVQREMRSARPN